MPRAGLTRDRVVAERLGVRVPSLYKHVDSLDDLVRSVSVRCVTELTAIMRDAAVGVARDDAVRSLARAYRAWATEHPGRYRLAQRAPAAGDAEAIAAATAAVDVVVSTLAGFGFGPDQEVDAVRGLRAAIHGFVSLEAAGGFGMARSTDESFDALIASLLRGYS